MIQLVIPAAGNGQRFKDAGYSKPKHLIDVLGKPMIERVVDNLKPNGLCTVQVITRGSLKSDSRGAVETILQATLDPEEPLLIGNCDQLVAFNVNDFVESCEGLDGGLVVFRSNKEHHSYVEESGDIITRIAEKQVISNLAVTGVYYFQRAGDFIDAGREVIGNNDRYNNEFYVSSAIARMIDSGLKLGVYEAATAILGTPAELQLFEAASEVSKWVE